MLDRAYISTSQCAGQGRPPSAVRPCTLDPVSDDRSYCRTPSPPPHGTGTTESAHVRQASSSAAWRTTPVRGSAAAVPTDLANSSDKFAVAEDGRDGESLVRLRCPEPVHGLAHAVWTRRFGMNALRVRSSGADLGCWQYPAAVPSCLVDRANPALLAYVLHLPPSAVPLVSDYRFRRSAQRLARLTL
jgi:hypothetical protein